MKKWWHKLIEKVKLMPRWLLNLLIIVIAIRALVPVVGLYGINWALRSKIKNYSGSVQDFDLSLYRGAYQLKGFEIHKIGSLNPPLVSLDEVNLSLSWGALLRGEINANVSMDRLIVHLIDSDKENEMDDSKDEGWNKIFSILIPISIEGFKITNSEVHLQNNFFATPAYVHLTHIFFNARDLKNKKNLEGPVISPFIAYGRLQGKTPLLLSGKVDLLSDPPRFDADFSVKKFELSSINNFLRAYIPLDITHCTTSLFAEIASSQGISKGYVKVFFHDADVISNEQNFVSFQHFRNEIPTAFINLILKNSKNQNFAFYLPFEKKDEKFDIDGSTAFWSAVQNRFEELVPQIDHSISLSSLEDDIRQNP